jgi:GTP-binding protein
MRFYDRVKVKVISWDGGNGCVSWRREKYIAYGWPDGWDWGRWGSVYFVGDEWLSSLLDLHYKKQIKAKRGEHGKGSQQYGASAEDVFVKVPIGTVVKDKSTGKVLGTILKHGQKLLVAKWWRWWWWNMHFKNAVKQYPDFAMYGEPGEEKEIEAELQLIWDVALIWFPSVGKSSIINTLSNTKAKVAEYSFTTLVPNLWVVKHKNKDFVLVDVPWLIEWAWEGKGLGIEFLRHILKSKIWTFVLDTSRYEDSLKELEILKKEIETYLRWKEITEDLFWRLSEDKNDKNIKFIYENYKSWLKLKVYLNDKLLFEKFILFVLNKIDLIQDEEILQELEKQIKEKIKELFSVDSDKVTLFKVSAWNKNLFKDYLDTIVELLKEKINQDAILDEYLQPKEIIKADEELEPYVKDITEKELDYLIKEWYIEEEEAENVRVFEVWNKKLAYYTWILPWWNKEAEMFFFDVMNWEWISSWLENNGVMVGDILKVKSPYAGKEDRYIMWKL